ncbi:MAG: signal peptidase I [Lachnospiraceae bacterium]|nr:signal peptidase I [Lachnospiraceae bacterium]
MTNKAVIKEIIEWVGVIVAALAISFAVNTFLIVNATVPSSSMERTIMAHDRIIGSRLSYLFGDPERGDIIIFKNPDNEEILYIKRLIGMPGETVEIYDGRVFIDGSPLYEPYLEVTTLGEFGPYKVPEGSYFMMGDNRNDSADSRYWTHTYLSREGIVGKAQFRYWPRIKRLK